MKSQVNINDAGTTLAGFNGLPRQDAIDSLMRCCGSQRWAERMMAARPFKSMEEIFDAAQRHWKNLEISDCLEAFGHHPRIGNLDSMRKKYAATSSWASEEQQGAQAASEETINRLAIGNAEYETKFGHIFLICATGKSASEMLTSLEARMTHDSGTEIQIAMDEQAKITRLRLEKLFRP